MRVIVNGQAVELPPGATVADVVRSTCPSPRGVAVAVERQVVPRSAWEEVGLCEGQRIEVLGAAAGG